MTDNEYNIVTFGDQGQDDRRKKMVDLALNSHIPSNELLFNLGLFLVPQTLSRIMFLDFLYKKILDVQGVVLDFGSRWGQNLSLFIALRGIYEPFNRLRKVVGFDTFTGFPGISPQDGSGKMMNKNSYSVLEGYEQYLAEILEIQEKESPMGHIKKHEIVKGDSSVEIVKYLDRNPETIVAFAYFDFDLYKPTKDCLEAIKPRITKGSVIGFDEINDHECPGETIAVMETLGLGKYSIKRYRYNSRSSYLVIE